MPTLSCSHCWQFLYTECCHWWELVYTECCHWWELVYTECCHWWELVYTECCHWWELVYTECWHWWELVYTECWHWWELVYTECWHDVIRIRIATFNAAKSYLHVLEEMLLLCLRVQHHQMAVTLTETFSGSPPDGVMVVWVCNGLWSNLR